MERVQRLAAHISPAQAAVAPNSRPVALILGAGAGIGQGVARKFAAEGYHVVAVRRGSGPNRLLTDNDDTVTKMEHFCKGLRDAGGEATAMFADCTKPQEVQALVQRIEEEIGEIHFVNYNIGAQVGDRTVDQTSYRIFELALQLGAVGAFAAAKEVAKFMIPRGHGTIIYTSSTAAMRGKDGQHAHTAAMGARRMLTQSLAAELGPAGIHIVHANIDGMINAPETLGGFMKRASGSDDTFNELVSEMQRNEAIVEPAAVAETYFHLHMQPKCVWTQELDLKPWSTKAWFSNSENNASSMLTKSKK